MFVIDLSSELRKLLPNIHNAFSAAAIHWAFLLLCKVAEFSEVNSSEMLLHFKNMLMETGKTYGDKITETHKYLDAVYEDFTYLCFVFYLFYTKGVIHT